MNTVQGQSIGLVWIRTLSQFWLPVPFTTFTPWSASPSFHSLCPSIRVTNPLCGLACLSCYSVWALKWKASMCRGCFYPHPPLPIPAALRLFNTYPEKSPHGCVVNCKVQNKLLSEKIHVNVIVSILWESFSTFWKKNIIKYSCRTQYGLS